MNETKRKASISGRLREWRRVEEDWAVPSLLSTLDASLSAPLLKARINSLLPLLSDHFRAEESPYGFFQALLTKAPECQAAVDTLILQHEDFLADLRELAEQIGAGALDEAAIRAARDELALRVRAHQQVEHSLVARHMPDDA